MKLGELQNSAKGWIADDCIWVEADIKLLNVDCTRRVAPPLALTTLNSCARA